MPQEESVPRAGSLSPTRNKAPPTQRTSSRLGGIIFGTGRKETTSLRDESKSEAVYGDARAAPPATAPAKKASTTRGVKLAKSRHRVLDELFPSRKKTHKNETEAATVAQGLASMQQGKPLTVSQGLALMDSVRKGNLSSSPASSLGGVDGGDDDDGEDRAVLTKVSDKAVKDDILAVTGPNELVESVAVSQALSRRKSSMQDTRKRVMPWDVVHPHSQFRYYWDMNTMLMLVWVIIDVPFVVSFNVSDKPWSWHAICAHIVDLFFILDVILNFNTGVELNGQVFLDRPTIAKEYIKSW